jgi:hypothetical protein
MKLWKLSKILSKLRRLSKKINQLRSSIFFSILYKFKENNNKWWTQLLCIIVQNYRYRYYYCTLQWKTIDDLLISDRPLKSHKLDSKRLRRRRGRKEEAARRWNERTLIMDPMIWHKVAAISGISLLLSAALFY